MVTALPALQVIRCIGQQPDCPACRAEPPRPPVPHVCDELCAMQAENRRDRVVHARSHAPKVHECGQLLDDRRGNRFEKVAICGWGTCVQYLCPGCGQFVAGFGPVGCRCENQPCEHGTFEQFLPPATRRGLLAAVFRRR